MIIEGPTTHSLQYKYFSPNPIACAKHKYCSSLPVPAQEPTTADIEMLGVSLPNL